MVYPRRISSTMTRQTWRKRLIFKRGIRYPERVMNSTKTSTSLMLAGTAAGEILPVYVVYKSEHLWSTWIEGGPHKARFNRSKSGWFDQVCFVDWFRSIALPYCRGLEGKKVLMGDNLSSRNEINVLEECERNNISFVCLPPNATHLLQPLDVANFGPMKATCLSCQTRAITSKWASKSVASILLTNRLPQESNEAVNNSVSEVFTEHLSQLGHHLRSHIGISVGTGDCGCIIHLVHIAAKKGSAELGPIEEALVDIYYYFKKRANRQNNFAETSSYV
ncbi:hypothetical protein EGW08_000922 [Elysia chlorotica]|uniref:DDE-1 domain-containing protein n=1 Tax=Elysia chlorotica TaxID=188477 RepID=A0A3S1BU15_ELYCH|nr:hypothetical protein EGW08_000922 [Elysia chlorotica]